MSERSQGYLIAILIIIISLIFLALITTKCRAQSVSVSPTSLDLWGATEGVKTVGVEYKLIGVHLFLYNRTDQFSTTGHPVKKKAFAISILPINIAGIVRSGVMIFDRRYPEESGTRINFHLDVGYNIGQFRFSYTHTSNCYTGRSNSGIDGFKIKYKLQSI